MDIIIDNRYDRYYIMIVYGARTPKEKKMSKWD